jgi:ATP-dependent Lon protease
MTGEITLQGRILSIGGLKEKILAAKQHGCPTIIMPKENADDLEDIKKEMSLDGLDIKFASNMDEVLKIAFMKNPLDTKIRPMKKRPAKPTGKKSKTI